MMNGSGYNWYGNTGGAADNIREGSIDIYNTGNNKTDGSNINDSTIERQTGNRNIQVSRVNLTVDTPNKAFEGVDPDIKCVL